MAKRADVKIGFVCNNNCRFCVQAHKKQFGSRTVEDIKKDLEMARCNCSAVVFTGGEPTIHPGILELVAYADHLGFRDIQIQTNARRFAYLDFCKKMIEAGANEFSPALHGDVKGLHDYLTRSPGSFDQTVQAIKNLKQLGMRVITNTVIVKPNYRYADRIAQLLVNLGVEQYQLAFVHPIGNAGKYYDSIVPCVSLASPFIRKGLQVGLDAGVKVMAEAMPFCQMSGYEDCVSELVIPPTEIRDVVDFDPDYERTRKTQGKAKFRQCKECKYDLLCEGPWKEYPERKGCDEFVPVKGEKIVRL
jgi:sulfatase maturation enzyme AslB (radical SAM superfamily)